jgi:predicted nucleic acid-binding protein
MIVVADTSPLNYLVQIEAVNVLEPLYNRVVVPQTVADEINASGTPADVRAWMSRPPAWLDIAPDPPLDETLGTLDPGERAAIALALSLHASRLLIDDSDGRAAAERRSLRVTGTLGVLAAAHRSGLLDFDTVVARLSNTTFYLSPRLLATARRLLAIPAKS